MKQDVAIVIPAYNPTEELKNIMNDLQKNEYSHIVVIDDGSKDKAIFETLKEQVTVIEHKKNYGKGRALKTGIKYVFNNIDDIKGIITVDADGQHQINDINHVYGEFKKQQDHLILGTRNFHGKHIPLRSKLGNKVIAYIVNRKFHKKLQDTQTGLRAIPKQYFQECLQIEGDRFEYEIYMIIHCIKKNIPIVQVPIKSVYINHNKGSHYHVIKDSYKIYKATSYEIVR